MVVKVKVLVCNYPFLRCGRAGMPEGGKGSPDFRCCEYGSDFVITQV